jgi:hypothetical protein
VAHDVAVMGVTSGLPHSAIRAGPHDLDGRSADSRRQNEKPVKQ